MVSLQLILNVCINVHSINPNKALKSDPKSYAPFVALRYNATKATKLLGQFS